jgi:hypothetical protein
MGSALVSCWRRKNAIGAKSLNDLPDEILLKIFSDFGPYEICVIFPKVCKRWNALAKHLSLWKTFSYLWIFSPDSRSNAEVRCITLLAFRTHILMNFPNIVF